jgi:hypothetical protein
MLTVDYAISPTLPMLRSSASRFNVKFRAAWCVPTSNCYYNFVDILSCGLVAGNSIKHRRAPDARTEAQLVSLLQ